MCLLGKKGPPEWETFENSDSQLFTSTSCELVSLLPLSENGSVKYKQTFQSGPCRKSLREKINAKDSSTGQTKIWFVLGKNN